MKVIFGLLLVALFAVANAHGYYDERNPTLVAYWPLNDGTNGQTVTEAIDVVAYPGHPATNAVAEGSGGYWTNDTIRGIVYRTVQGHRLTAGTQGITTNFTWSLWVKTLEDITGSIMGTRSTYNGKWNKLTANKFENWGTVSGWSITTNSPWHHLAVRGTVNPDGLAHTVEVYLDGVLKGSGQSAFVVYDGALEIGGANLYTEDIGGLMSDVAIWNEALSEERIQELAAGDPVIIGPPAGTVLIIK